MQATRTLGGKGLSNSGASVVVAIAAAFLIGAGGGYAARSASSVAPATGHAGTVSVSALHQQAPDAADRNAQLGGLRAGGPGGQIGDVPAGYDPNALVSAPIRVVVPAGAQAGDDFCAAINRHKAC